MLISLWKPFWLFVITFVFYDNVICKAEVGNESSPDADTTFMIIQSLTYEGNVREQSGTGTTLFLGKPE